MLKSMKAQKRQLEDQLNGAKRAAEATVRDLSATKQELEDAKQTLAGSEQRLRLGASAQEQVRISGPGGNVTSRPRVVGRAERVGGGLSCFSSATVSYQTWRLST